MTAPKVSGYTYFCECGKMLGYTTELAVPTPQDGCHRVRVYQEVTLPATLDYIPVRFIITDQDPNDAAQDATKDGEEAGHPGDTQDHSKHD